MGVFANLSDDQSIHGVGITGLNKASEALYLGNSEPQLDYCSLLEHKTLNPLLRAISRSAEDQ